MIKNILENLQQSCLLFAIAALSSALQPAEANEGTAADLVVLPRWSLGHSASGAGYDGFTFFDGFIPLEQTPGRELTFLNSRLSLDNGANPGINLLLGRRIYLPRENRIIGGYLAYDVHNTGQSTFHQAGLGLASLGEIWDIYLNGYIPLGDTRQQISDFSIDTGLQPIGEPRFQGNSLIFSAERSFSRVQRFEEAMGGGDLDIGARLAQFDGGGDLRVYGGVYYYTALGSPNILGGSLRFVAQPTQSFRLGLGLQHDALFGTNILFNLGVTLPSRDSNPLPDASRSVLARLGEPADRKTRITVTSQTESEAFIEQATVVATNPETGNPYHFQHVNLDLDDGQGLIESPFGDLETALTTATPDDIVYVQSGANPGVPGLTIPDDVWVLSTGPVQTLETAEFGVTRLPLSGAGTLPTVTDTVTMGNNTVLSGFTIENASGAGVESRDVSNVAILNNRIADANDYGILLRNVSGNVTIENNNITETAGTPTVLNLIDLNDSTLPLGQGIAFVNDTETDVNLTVASNNLENNNNQGILLVNINGEVNILENIIRNTNGFAFEISGIVPIFFADSEFPTGQGLLFANTAGEIDQLTISGNEIEQNVSQGVLLSNLVGGQIEVTDNSIIGTTGIAAEFPDLPSGQGLALINVIPGNIDITLSDQNRISENADDGFFLLLSSPIAESTPTEATTANVNISNNRIENNGDSTDPSGDGISLVLEGNARMDRLVILDNVINNNGDDGVDIRSGFISSTVSDLLPISIDSNAQINNTSIRGNTINLPSNGNQVGIRLDAHQATRLQATVENNQILEGNPGLEATLFANTAGGNLAEICLRIQDNQNSDPGFNLLNIGAGTFQVLNLTTILTDNTGSTTIGPGITTGTTGIAPCP